MLSLTYLVWLIGTLATLLVAIEGVSGAMQALSVGIVLCGSLSYLALKAEQARRQLGELHRLQAAYDQLDQQAKLIIRTDLELHRTQEELDRRLASLLSLHQLGQRLRVNLRPDEVFQQLDAMVVTNFGFVKGLLGVIADDQTIVWGSLIGLTRPAAEGLTLHLKERGLLAHVVAHPDPQAITSATSEPALRQLLALLEVPSAVIAGIVPHAGPRGVLLLGRMGSHVATANAEEELVSILVNQLATSVENSELFERSWAAQQELEEKVRERTRQLAEANTELVRFNKAKSDFVSAVSHELRTPLAAIKGYASLLGSGQFGALSQAQGERIGKIEKHSDLLTQFINNLLDIARIESGRITMERREIPIEEFFAMVQDVVHPQLEAKRLRYTCDLDSVQYLVGDPQHLQRVFINLLSNAIKYTPERGTIAVGLKRDGDRIVATVRDTGCGIAPGDLKKLFQEFYRAEDPINQEIRGSGLGLALVKRIVEAHQGQIWVESEKGKGSTFFVNLPAR